MLGVGTEIGASALRLWVAAGSAALLIVFFGFAFFRTRSRIEAGPPWEPGFVVVGAILGAVMTWAFFDPSEVGDQGAERRALQLRAEELGARALAPGSPLACLDAVAGESVEAACEKALFVSPASVASASSYVAARLALLSAMVAYAGRGGADLESALSPLRRSLEVDRFGFVAHVLAIRDGCTSQKCTALALLHDPGRVRANLGAQPLDRYLEHYQEVWAKAADAPAGDVASAAAQSGAPVPRKLVNVDFPSAASIPPISIMNPEPTGPVLPGAAAAAAANPNPAPSATANQASRHSRKQAANPSAPIVPQAAAPGSTAIEPIWPEPVPPPPPQTAATSVGAPVQLNPPSPSAGATARAQ
jgi:hypothetical protein